MFADKTASFAPKFISMKSISLLAIFSLFFFSACSNSGSEADDASSDSTQVMTLPSGVEVSFEQNGDGVLPQMGQRVTVHYRGMLDDGTVFDESFGREPFTFAIGQGQVIDGWDQGVAQLSKGAKATLFIPSNLAYGAQGAGGVIPPNANLSFYVEVLEIKDAPQPIAHESWSTEGLEKHQTESGLSYYIIEEGEGALAQPGKVVSVHYMGMLEDGTKFDSSFDRGEPIEFQLGTGRVIPGWDEGISLLTVGSKAKLIIPSELAYGERAVGNVIPANATLIFDVELVAVK
jgi:peptidylprolyl isomerase